ncbi:phosphoglycolate phosphatase [Limimonas halophila]|uniref:Phosphoglycolate phosphatase n=1 Tax=Limimonas halophila TaxID=1082479 RepID=A0A1G7UM98_9PROT|nr:HAD-IA family hydrolase [Limimonas halophila]SDG48644.1 phosphoglycolate phosphatase [Limimonas halophila]
MTHTHGFDLIVFDLDGTLVDSQHTIVAAMHDAFAAEGLPAPEAEAVRRVVGLSLDAAVARLLPRDAGEAYVARVAEGYKTAFTRRKAQADDSEVLFPGVREVLRALDAPEVCLAVATGKSRRGLVSSLDRHGLAGHFVSLQTADDAPGKPHPRMLELAMADVGAGPGETVVIGDTAFDMEMARTAGASAVGVGWGYHPAAELTSAGAARVLDSFDELPPALAALRPRTA